MEKNITYEEDKAFEAVIFKDISYFHELYKKYGNPNALEVVRNLAVYLEKINNRMKKHEANHTIA